MLAQAVERAQKCGAYDNADATSLNEPREDIHREYFTGRRPARFHRNIRIQPNALREIEALDIPFLQLQAPR